MPYKVTIEKIEEKITVEHGDWVIIEERPYTDDEIAKTAAMANKEAWAVKEKKIYGHAPDKEVTKTVTSKLYEQTVDMLHIPSVISTINGGGHG